MDFLKYKDDIDIFSWQTFDFRDTFYNVNNYYNNIVK